MSVENDFLEVQNINSQGYGIVAKLVMKDKRLTITAKAIYSYFCSYAGAGRQAFPKVKAIVQDLQVSKDTYYRHFRLLKKFGYIKVKQNHANGKLTSNIYTLVEDIPKESENLQCPKNQYTEIYDTENLQCPKNQYTEIYDTNNINSFKNSKDISLSCQSHKKGDKADGQDRQDGQAKADEKNNGAEKIKAAETRIDENISYDVFLREHFPQIKLVDEFRAVMLDVLMTNAKTCRVNQVDEPIGLVRHNILKIRHSHILYLVEQLENYTEPVKKKTEFMRSMLYNAAKEERFHYANSYYSGVT